MKFERTLDMLIAEAVFASLQAQPEAKASMAVEAVDGSLASADQDTGIFWEGTARVSTLRGTVCGLGRYYFGRHGLAGPWQRPSTQEVTRGRRR